MAYISIGLFPFRPVVVHIAEGHALQLGAQSQGPETSQGFRFLVDSLFFPLRGGTFFLKFLFYTS